MVREGRENLGYLEGSFSFGCKFRVDDVSFEVSGFKPNFVSGYERGEFGLDAAFHGLSGEFVGH